MNDQYRCEKFAQDVAYVVANSPLLVDHIQRRLAHIYDISVTETGITKKGERTDRKATHVKMFPGAIVCSLLRENIPELVDVKNEYVALEKTDGVRYLLLLTTFAKTPYAMLIDRKMEMRIVNLDLPLEMFQREVLFDGELAQNIENGLYTFLIFDFIYNGKTNDNSFRNAAYTNRMKQATEIIRENWQRHTTTEAEYRAYNTDTQNVIKNTFNLKVKKYVQIHEFSSTFSQVLDWNQWTHHGFRIDGFIFVPSKQIVEPFRNFKQFKFKPSDRHTIDVQLLRNEQQNYEIFAKNARNCAEKLENVRVTAENTTFLQQNKQDIEKSILEKKNYIVECMWSKEEKCWILKHPRSDKHVPNALHTVHQTKQNIEEDIHLAELAALFQKPSKPKGPTIHPSRQGNFKVHQLPSFYSKTDCDSSCVCEFCVKKVQTVSPLNDAVTQEPSAKRSCTETAAKKARVFFSDLDLDMLLNQTKDPNQLEKLKNIS